MSPGLGLASDSSPVFLGHGLWSCQLPLWDLTTSLAMKCLERLDFIELFIEHLKTRSNMRKSAFDTFTIAFPPGNLIAKLSHTQALKLILHRNQFLPVAFVKF